MASYDIIGNIAIIKPTKTKKQKSLLIKELLKKPSIKTVLEKTTKVKGRLRTIKTKYISKSTGVIFYQFKLNVETCYFSPRQSNDRKQVALKIKKKDKVLVMFSGIGAYPIIIYKLAKPKQITAIEISKECNKYFKENLRLNKIPKSAITIIRGDVKKKLPSEKFSIIMMARPNLKTTFLEQALKVSKKGTKIFYHGFCRDSDLKNLKKDLINEAKKLKRKIKITKVVKAGEIAPYKFRYRIEIIVN